VTLLNARRINAGLDWNSIKMISLFSIFLITVANAQSVTPPKGVTPPNGTVINAQGVTLPNGTVIPLPNRTMQLLPLLPNGTANNFPKGTTSVIPQVTVCPYNTTDGLARNTTLIQCSFFQSPWNCPKGSFCQLPGQPKRCSPGFFCPRRSFQPIYCPGGFQCTNDSAEMRPCPENFYCPMGTVKPYQCSYLASCPKGTEKAPKIALFLYMLVLLLIPVFFFKWKDSSNDLNRLRHKYEVVSIDNRSSASLVDQQALSRLDKTFDIEFDNLSLTLPNGVTIMSGVSGALRSGRTTAIMGPSGAGKTTFITLLTGKSKRTTGSVLINGKPDELSNYKKLIGYVPQEDIMLRELTVRDILMHSARMRLPAGWDYKKIKTKVLEIISFLGMSHVLDSIVGNEEERGISGGQRKRVNIGMIMIDH